MSPRAPVNEQGTSDLERQVEPAHPDVQIRPTGDDEDVPARRLLAHDLDHIVWDEDGEGRLPPPD